MFSSHGTIDRLLLKRSSFSRAIWASPMCILDSCSRPKEAAVSGSVLRPEPRFPLVQSSILDTMDTVSGHKHLSDRIRP